MYEWLIKAVRVLEGLMESESEDTQAWAVDTLARLAEIEVSLLNALGMRAAAEGQNPLARKYRDRGGRAR